MIEQYRDELLMALHGHIDELQVAQEREAVASGLLNILHSYATFTFPHGEFVSHDSVQHPHSINCN